ncbi:MAG: phage portal protein [Firmicutes bacterium]|nr:phage portal protein [Bacillota bacterium]
MLQIANLTELEAKDIPKLLERVEPILKKRRQLHEKYTRKADGSTVMFSNNNNTTIIPFEKFITDLATGYLSGKPTYSVSDTSDENKKKLLQNLLDKKIKDDNYKNSMEIIIDYVSSYNDDSTENYDLIHDILELTSCYEIIYENQNNEIVYSKYDPLQTVACWDYSIPANLTGLIRVWEEEDINRNHKTMVELTDKNGSRIYSKNKKEVIEEERNNHNWGDVPAIAVETDFSIFETCEDIIQSYEQLIQNVRNTYQYNDSDCKMKLTGYTPENPMILPDEEGNPQINPARIKEDEMWIKSLTIYVGEGGDVSWLIKQLDATGVQTILKVYIDLMFQIAGIPNTSDLAFNSADLNASAIDRKFYVMNMATANIVSQLKKAYLRRWELIFGRINLKKSTEFDFRDIMIDLPKNLPANDDEKIDSMLKLQNILSLQTIIEKLGYNYIDEKNKKDAESEDNILANIEHMKMFGNAEVPTEEIGQEENEEKEEE